MQGRRVAVAVAVAMHGALGAALVLQPKPPGVTEPAVFNVEIMRVTPTQPEPPEPAQPAAPAAAAKVRARAAPLTAATNPIPAGVPATAAPPAAPLGPPSSPVGLDPAMRGSLTLRLDCREPRRSEERTRCAQRLVDSPVKRLAEMNPYARIADQMGVMASVRRAENSSRASCDAMRNLDPTCINLLPDNLPGDSELKRGAPPPR